MIYNPKSKEPLNFILPNGYGVYGTAVCLSRNGNTFAELNVSQTKEIHTFLENLS